VRATIVMPALFALTFEVVGNLQMALFAAFGSFATLVMTGFGGTRHDKLMAHLGLAVAGSIGLTIGTLASGRWWTAAIATLLVAFAFFFGGVISPNAAAGTNGALLSFVLPVATAGGASTIPDRLAGWWLASVVGTVAVLLISPAGPGDRLRAAAAELASALSTTLNDALHGDTEAVERSHDATIEAKRRLMDIFISTPYRPTGLATADQALGSVVQVLEWSTSLLCDAFDGHVDFTEASPADRELLTTSAAVFRDIAELLTGSDVALDVNALEAGRAASMAAMHDTQADDERSRAAAAYAAHAQTIAIAARTAAVDTLIASGKADPETVAEQRRVWYGANQVSMHVPGLAGAAGVIGRHASARSVWMVNSLRGAAALAAAVAIADVSGVQHGFWVVLGTLSVLRTNAAGTGAAAWRALIGTAIGFAAGALLLLAIGTTSTALWVALPVAVFIASYAPGTAPFAFGQAAFTVTVAVLFNLLVPVGWKVGLLRVQDVAIGCAVSLVVGALFWPRGANGVVGRDLADAFRSGAQYLTQSVDWAVGARSAAPSAGAASFTADLRLEDALRAFLAEQGSKRASKTDLYALVMGTIQLRLTANLLSGLSVPKHAVPESDALRLQTAGLALYYERLADEIESAGDPVTGGDLVTSSELAPRHPRALWVWEHLEHLQGNAQAIAEPAARLSTLRQRPWWR
jgi:uncharacterized membrane protein YccC